MNYIQTGDIQSYYEYYESASTSSTTIVFIHGTGLDSSYFHYLIPILRQQYSILLYDLRGHGQSEDGGKAATIELLCDDLLSLVQALGLHNLVIVGHTFGANIAVHFADRYETLIESLILISPQAFFCRCLRWPVKRNCGKSWQKLEHWISWENSWFSV